jgi:hypothetical protein
VVKGGGGQPPFPSFPPPSPSPLCPLLHPSPTPLPPSLSLLSTLAPIHAWLDCGDRCWLRSWAQPWHALSIVPPQAVPATTTTVFIEGTAHCAGACQCSVLLCLCWTVACPCLPPPSPPPRRVLDASSLVRPAVPMCVCACADMYPPRQGEPASLTAARNQILGILAEWAPPTPAPTPAPSPRPSTKPSSGLSKGAAAGIGVGCGVVAVAAVAAIVVSRRKASARQTKEPLLG